MDSDLAQSLVHAVIDLRSLSGSEECSSLWWNVQGRFGVRRGQDARRGNRKRKKQRHERNLEAHKREECCQERTAAGETRIE